MHNQSKEVFINQAGHSGGVSNSLPSTKFSLSWNEILGIISFCLVLAVVWVYGYQKFKKALERKVRS